MATLVVFKIGVVGVTLTSAAQFFSIVSVWSKVKI